MSKRLCAICGCSKGSWGCRAAADGIIAVAAVAFTLQARHRGPPQADDWLRASRATTAVAPLMKYSRLQIYQVGVQQLVRSRLPLLPRQPDLSNEGEIALRTWLQTAGSSVSHKNLEVQEQRVVSPHRLGVFWQRCDGQLAHTTTLCDLERHPSSDLPQYIPDLTSAGASSLIGLQAVCRTKDPNTPATMQTRTLSMSG